MYFRMHLSESECIVVLYSSLIKSIVCHLRRQEQAVYCSSHCGISDTQWQLEVYFIVRPFDSLVCL